MSIFGIFVKLQRFQYFGTETPRGNFGHFKIEAGHLDRNELSFVLSCHEKEICHLCPSAD